VTLENKSASGDIDLGVASHRVLICQAAITALVVTTFTFLGGMQSGIAALYGGMVAITLTWLLKRRVGGIVKAAGSNSSKSMLLLYLGVLQRFLLVLALFAIALGVLKLDPLASIVAFGLGQFGYVISRVLYKGVIS